MAFHEDDAERVDPGTGCVNATRLDGGVDRLHREIGKLRSKPPA